MEIEGRIKLQVARFSRGSILIPEANFKVFTSTWEGEVKTSQLYAIFKLSSYVDVKHSRAFDVFGVPRVAISSHLALPGSPWPIRKGLNSLLMLRSGHASRELPWHLGMPWCWRHKMPAVCVAYVLYIVFVSRRSHSPTFTHLHPSNNI